MTDSTGLAWHARPGVILAARYLRTHTVPIRSTPMTELPRFSKRMIRLALRLFPRFLDRVDTSFPIIVAGKGWYKIALDGRHRISKATWIDCSELPTVHVPVGFALELLTPGVYEVEWLGLALARVFRRRSAPVPTSRARRVRVAFTGKGYPIHPSSKG